MSACAPREDGGTTPVHVALEAEVAAFMGQEAAIVLGMGYATNTAIIPCFCGKGDLIVSDALNHASIVNGVRGSGAAVRIFKHNDAAHLEAVLRQAVAEGQPRSRRPWRKLVIVVEGIYSMEGEVRGRGRWLRCADVRRLKHDLAHSHRLLPAPHTPTLERSGGGAQGDCGGEEALQGVPLRG